jgi:hypothetical protein
MGRHFFPRPDVDLLVWGSRFVERVRDGHERLGLSPNDLAQLLRTWDAFKTSYTDHVDAHKRAAEAFERKQSTRQGFERSLRPLVRRIQMSPQVTDRHRADLGITVPKRRRSSLGEVVLGRPVVRVDASRGLVHVVRYADEVSPKNRRKPTGAKCAELWVGVAALGSPPMPPASAEGEPRAPYRLHSTNTRTPIEVRFSAAQENKVAHYLLRWVARSGGYGPWSEPAAATIAG